MSRLLRAPLTHFLLMGGLLWGLEPLMLRAFCGAEVIAVSSEQIADLRRSWQQETGRAPTRVELGASLRVWANEEMLLREAARLGLAERDAVVRLRLLQNMRFAFASEGQPASDEALLREAQKLGMAEGDLVVRRRLVQTMEHHLQRVAAPSEAALQAYVQAHPERYARATRIHFEQRLFSRDRRGANAEADARTALRALQAGGPDSVGDAFLHGDHFAGLTPTDVSRMFGADFSAALLALPPGPWQGPLASSYGWHLVQIDSMLPQQPADPAVVRRAAALAWQSERERAALSKALRDLRRSYRLELAPEVVSAVDPAELVP